jgi:hypothetical protein
MVKRKRGMGRPTKNPDEARSAFRAFRLRPALDKQLVEAAAAANRTVSDEIDFRLQQSFQKDVFSREAVASLLNELIAGRGDPELARRWRDSAGNEHTREIDRQFGVPNPNPASRYRPQD